MAVLASLMGRRAIDGHRFAQFEVVELQSIAIRNEGEKT